MANPIPRRKVFFVACEGESERGYAALLKEFADSIKLHIHIRTEIMTTGGEPMDLVKKACKAAIKHDKQGSSLAGRFLLLDTDRIGRKPDDNDKIYKVAADAGLTLIWQDKCFESVLLRHFPGHKNDNPPTSKAALTRLKKVCPEYDKGMSATDLRNFITLQNVRRAAKSRLNEDLAVLIRALGLSDDGQDTTGGVQG